MKWRGAQVANLCHQANMNDSPKEMACLDRAEIWEGLIGFCEEVEREEMEAKVDKNHRLQTCASGDAKDHRLQTCATNQKPKTKNQKRLLKGMSRAVARDLGLI